MSTAEERMELGSVGGASHAASVVQSADDLPPEPEIKGPLKPVAEYTPLETLALCFGTTTAIFALLNMIQAGGFFLIVLSGALAMVMGPYLYYQRNLLTDIRTFKETQEFIEKQVRLLKTNNEELQNNIDSLELTTIQLQKFSKTFSTVTALAGKTIDEFAKQLEQQKQNVKDQAGALTGEVQEQLLDLLEGNDADMDSVFDEDEVLKFIEQLKLIEGIKIYEENIKQQMVNKSIDESIDLIFTLHDKTAPKDKILYEVLS